MASDGSMVIPEAEAAPKEGTLPVHFESRNNLAGDEVLANEVLAHLSRELETFSTQDARKKFCGTNGTMDTADRAWRVALRRNTTSDQYQKTLSDVASSVFHRAIRAMTAGENAIFFQGAELPARYEVDLNTDDYTPQTGIAMAEQRNLVRDYTWERDRRRNKIKRGNMFKNKYGQQLWSKEWDYCKEMKTVKVYDERTGKVKRVKKEMYTREWPTLLAHDLNNFYTDAYIDEIQNQRTTLLHKEMGYEQLAELQKAGFIKNLEKITAAQAATGEVDETLKDRRTNAGESAENHPTGLLNVWECWARLSIKESGTSGKGKIDRKVAPEWYWCTYVGGGWDNMSGAVCVRLIKNPYDHGKLPYFMDYAYHDDKGFYHVAPINLVESAYWQAVTSINQAIDNVTLRTRAPFTVDGPVFTRDLTFQANKVIKLGRGTTFKPIEVPITTQITMEMLAYVESEILKALGITQTIEGTPLGGRTSASEAENDLDQAMKPLLQKADENGQWFYSWDLESDAELWDQFARPELALVITHMPPLMVQPADIYGPINVKVTAVGEFENKTARRREWSALFQSGMYDRMAEIMPRESKSIMFRQIGTDYNMRRVNELFPPAGDMDAVRVARAESADMLLRGAFDAAEDGENHATHIEQHESFLHEYEFLPDADQNPEWARNLQGHIEQHRVMMAKASQRQAPSLQEGTTGELAANPIEAQAGAEANL